MTDRLIDVTYRALTHHVWADRDLTRLLDGVVTPRDLDRARHSVTELKQLAEMTKKGAPDSVHTFESLGVVFWNPRPYQVTVQGKEVVALYAKDSVRIESNMNRSHARRAALLGVALATELHDAIRDQLVMQSGVRTALEELKDSAADAAVGAREKTAEVTEQLGRALEQRTTAARGKADEVARKVGNAIEPGARAARETLGGAKNRLQSAAAEIKRRIGIE